MNQAHGSPLENISCPECGLSTNLKNEIALQAYHQRLYDRTLAWLLKIFILFLLVGLIPLAGSLLLVLLLMITFITAPFIGARIALKAALIHRMAGAATDESPTKSHVCFRAAGYTLLIWLLTCITCGLGFIIQRLSVWLLFKIG